MKSERLQKILPIDDAVAAIGMILSNHADFGHESGCLLSVRTFDDAANDIIAYFALRSLRNADPNHQLTEAYERCAKIRDAVGQWIEAYREQGRTPTLADALHSALLGRFLEGKRFFPEPPPRSFSYPWYNLIETGRDDQCEMYLPNDRPTEIVINQAVWEVLEKLSDNIFRVRWPGTTPEYTAVIHAESFKSTITLNQPKEAKT